MRLLERCDAVRQAERFALVLQACECDARGRLGFEEAAYPQAGRLLNAQQAALSVETAPIAQAAATQGLKGTQIGEQITQARIQAIALASL
jgi:tRNA nucleotidyltransferase (CCA-adding enzyme)